MTLLYPTADQMRSVGCKTGRLRGVTVADRLARAYVVEVFGCWRWTLSTTTSGYGHLSVGDRHLQAHRLMYILHVGPLPAGLQLDHLCRNRICVNPAHLEAVRAAENVQRGEAARLTPPIVQAIRRAYRPWDRTASMRVLASRYAVDHTTVFRVLRGQTWVDDRPAIEIPA